jgi:hypothetical protein
VAQPEDAETSAQAEASGNADVDMSVGAEAQNIVAAVKAEDADGDDELNTPPPREEEPPQASAPLAVPEGSAAKQTRSPSPAQTGVKPIPTGPKAEDPASRGSNAEQRVQKNERDGEAWLGLIEDATARRDMDEIRERYEGFLKVFPNAVSAAPCESHSRLPLMPNSGAAMARLHLARDVSVALQLSARRGALHALPADDAQRGALAAVPVVHTPRQPAAARGWKRV